MDKEGTARSRWQYRALSRAESLDRACGPSFDTDIPNSRLIVYPVVGAGWKGVEVVSRELELVVEHHRHLRRSQVGVGEKTGALKALGLHGARRRNALAHG